MKRFALSLAALSLCQIGLSQDCSCTPTQCIPQSAPASRAYVREHTVLVPQIVVHRKRIQVQEVQMQVRDKFVTVYDQVPEVVNVTTQETVMTQELRMQPVTQTYMQAVPRDVIQNIFVPVQAVENRVTTRHVVRNLCVRVRKQIVSQQMVLVPTNGGMMQQVCQPVTQDIEVMEYRPYLVTEQCVCAVPVTRMQAQQQRRQVIDYRPVQQTVNVPVTVTVPRVQPRTQQFTQMRTVPRTITQSETVPVSVTVDKEIEVPVTQFVPRTVRTTVCETEKSCVQCNAPSPAQ